jgi:hypothetical protein
MTGLRLSAAALGLAWACVLATHAQAQAQTPAAPPQRAPITLQGNGPFHRLPLPLAIYGRAAFDDLRDLRVRNAAGHAVPFAWLGAEPDATPPRTASARAPLFAVPPSAPGATAAEGPVVLKLRADGTLAWAAGAAPTSPAASTSIMQWVIDASTLHADLVQARFEIAAGAQGLFAFTLEGSDDLRQWHAIAADDQLVRLQRGDQTIERLAVELDHTRARYLRLRWHDPAQAPALTGVWLDSEETVEAVPALEWTDPVRAASCRVDYCDYPVPRGLPLHSLRLTLVEPNTLAALRISSLLPPSTATRPPPRNALYVLRHGSAHRPRDAATPQEELLADTVVYRLTQPGGEARSPTLPMDGGAHVTLRLRTSGPIAALGSTPPVLTFGARPRALVFLARGQPPFALSWSTAGQAPVRDAAALPLASLMPGHRIGQPVVADGASVVLAPEPAAPAAASAASTTNNDTPPRKLWLWAALGAGLLVIAGMAWSLLRGLGDARTPPAD